MFSFLVMAAMIFLAEDAILIRNALAKDKPILGLTVAGTVVSGKDTAHLKAFLRSTTGAGHETLKLTYDGGVLIIDQRDVGAKLDLSDTVARLLRVGRDKNLIHNIITQNLSALRNEHIALSAVLDKQSLLSVLSSIALQANRESVPPMPDFTHDLSRTIPPKDGVKIDTDALARLIGDHIFNPPAYPLPIPVIATRSAHDIAELDSIRSEVPRLVHESIKIKSAGQIFTLTTEDLLSLLTVVERPNPKDPQKTILALRIDDTLLNKKLGEFGRTVEDITHAEFDDHDARIAIYAQFYSATRRIADIPTGGEIRSSQALKENGRLAQAETATDAGGKFVYLTFDDGPNNIYHPLVLNILKKYKVKATFFLVGQNSTRFDKITERTVAEGHIIGDHSLTHAFLPKLSADEILNEIKTAKDLLKPFNSDKDVILFRPPYGGVNKTVKQDAKDLHLKLVLWDVDPRDWSEPATDELVNRVVTHVHDGSDILLHSNHLATVRALPKIIEDLMARGYSFRTIDQQ